MKRYASFAHTVMTVWAMAGMLLIVLLAWATGPNSTWTAITATVTIGPFFVYAIGMLALGWGGVLRDEWQRARARRGEDPHAR